MAAPDATTYARLRRFAESDHSTLGILEVMQNNLVTYRCKCLELPDNANANNISRIPAGTYELVQLASSPAFNYRHFWIKAVPGRSGIKIHVANFRRQMEGCIAPGQEFRRIDDDNHLDVTESTRTLGELLEYLPNETHIVIEDRPDLVAAGLIDPDVSTQRLTPELPTPGA